MSMPRVIEPEWLDELPAGDARAIRSRRDLRRINALMMNARTIAGALDGRLALRSPLSVAELGAGDGTLMLKLVRKCTALRGAEVVLIDRHDTVNAATRTAFAEAGVRAEFVAADAFTWLESSSKRLDVVIANLFLHHFDDARLSALLRLIAQRTRILVACEPRRSAFALLASRLLVLIGCNDVSRHDARVSVRAGFNDAELSGQWQHVGNWRLEEGRRGLFSHCFIAALAGPAL
jgi:2-polyprenyl-3-methyl-5-hydroxy-6-metoxy-1,4-benzoquinol methylase